MILMAGCAGSNFQTTTAALTEIADITAADATGTAEDAEKEVEDAGTDKDSVPEGALVIVKQGTFSSGVTVTDPVEGEYDETRNRLDSTRAGNTAHVDHANVLY